MAHHIKIRRIGGSLGAIFPKELLDEMHVGEGEELTVLREGSDFRLVPKTDDTAAFLDAFEHGRKKYRETLRRLAE
jgi:antitoxin component of MazEF toxin-antitoxin module